MNSNNNNQISNNANSISLVLFVLLAGITILVVAWTWMHPWTFKSGALEPGKVEPFQNSKTSSSELESEIKPQIRKAFQDSIGREPRPDELSYFAGEVAVGRLQVGDVVALLRMTDAHIYSSGMAQLVARYPAAIDSTFPSVTNTPTCSSVLSRRTPSIASEMAKVRGEKLIDLIKRIFESLLGYYPDEKVIAEIINIYNAEASKKRHPMTSSTDIYAMLKRIIEELIRRKSLPPRDKGDSNNSGPNPGNNHSGEMTDDELEAHRKEECAEINGYEMYKNDKDEWLATLEKFQKQDDKKTKKKDTCESCVCPLRDQTSLIGTLLNDACLTKVGSLMPKFLYKEI